MKIDEVHVGERHAGAVERDGTAVRRTDEELVARKDGKSAMPEDLLKTLSNFELRDLVAYLVSLKTPWVEEEGHE